MSFRIVGNDTNVIALSHFLKCSTKFGIVKTSFTLSSVLEIGVDNDRGKYTKIIEEKILTKIAYFMKIRPGKFFVKINHS